MAGTWGDFWSAVPEVVRRDVLIEGGRTAQWGWRPSGIQRFCPIANKGPEGGAEERDPPPPSASLLFLSLVTRLRAGKWRRGRAGTSGSSLIGEAVPPPHARLSAEARSGPRNATNVSAAEAWPNPNCTADRIDLLSCQAPSSAKLEHCLAAHDRRVRCPLLRLLQLDGAKEGRDPSQTSAGVGIGPGRGDALEEANRAGDQGQRRRAVLPCLGQATLAGSPRATRGRSRSRGSLGKSVSGELCRTVGSPLPTVVPEFQGSAEGRGLNAWRPLPRLPAVPHFQGGAPPRARKKSILFVFCLRVTPRVSIGPAVSNVYEPLEGWPGSGRLSVGPQQRPWLL